MNFFTILRILKSRPLLGYFKKKKKIVNDSENITGTSYFKWAALFSLHKSILTYTNAH